MTNDHERFRSSLPGYLFELLPEPDQAWSQAHATACPECAALLERIRSRLPELQDEAGHVPVRVLEGYALGAGSLTPLETEIVRRHLRDCEACRDDAREMAEAAGAARITPMRAQARRSPRRALTAGLVAAAALVIVFSVRLASWRSPGAPGGLLSKPNGRAPQLSGGVSSPPTEPPRDAGELVVLSEQMRGLDAHAVVKAPVPLPGSGVRLRVPRLFLSGAERVQVRLIRGDGSVAWTSMLEADALESELFPSTPTAGWTPGAYRLEIIPGAGTDTAAKRVFSFELLERR